MGEPIDTSEVRPDSGGEPVRGFRISQLHYDFRRIDEGIEVQIPYVYRNVTGDPVYFINCNEIIVCGTAPKGWRRGYSPRRRVRT